MKNLRYPKTFETEEDLKKWLNENNIKYLWVFIFKNRDWKYSDLEGFEHLYRNGVELTKGVKVTHTWSFDNGDWAYKDLNGFEHLFRDGVESTKGVKAIYVDSYEDGGWEYIDKQYNRHEFDKDNNKIN